MGLTWGSHRCTSCSWHCRLHPSMYKLFLTLSTASLLNSCWLSSAVCQWPKFAQLGDGVAPKRCTIIWCSSGSLFKSLFDHQRNRRASQSRGLTCTWWNIDSTSAMSATGSCRKRVRTPTKLFVRSGPWRSWSFSDVPWCFAAQSNTTQILSGLFELRTGIRTIRTCQSTPWILHLWHQSIYASSPQTHLSAQKLVPGIAPDFSFIFYFTWLHRFVLLTATLTPAPSLVKKQLIPLIFHSLPCH